MWELNWSTSQSWTIPLLAKGTEWLNIGKMGLGILEVACSLYNSDVGKNTSIVQASRQVHLAMTWYPEFSVEGWCLQLFQQELKRSCCLFWYYCIAEAEETIRPLHNFYAIQKAEISAFSVLLEWKYSNLHNVLSNVHTDTKKSSVPLLCLTLEEFLFWSFIWSYIRN